MRKTLFIFFITLSSDLFGQELKKECLSSEEKEAGMIKKYYGFGFEEETTLQLYNNSDYKFSINSGLYKAISYGKWEKKKEILFLYSKIKSDNVPIRVEYSSDTSLFGSDYKLGIVKNLNNEDVISAIVYINDEESECAPIIGSCSKNINSIDSLKIVFENGMSSKWLKIEKPSSRIDLIVQMDAIPGRYYPFDLIKFKISGSKLKRIQ